jgi:hypothetical protein
MRRGMTFLSVLAAVLLAGGTGATALDRAAPGGAAADEVQHVHWSVTAGGRGRHPDSNLRDSRTVGFGELLVRGGPIKPGERTGGRERGKIVHEDERMVGRTLIDDRLTIAFRDVGEYLDGREEAIDREGNAVETGFQRLTLHGFVTKSDDPTCPARPGGERRAVKLLLIESVDGLSVMHLDVHACPSHEHSFLGTRRVRVRIVAPEAEACPSRASAAAACTVPQPTSLTLTVNGASVTATKSSPSAHAPTPLELPSDSSLAISAGADKAMPPGWKLVVYHTGDPQSEGNGVYYKVCEADAGSASCGDTRPGRTGPSDDEVYAQVLAPTYVALNAVIDIHYDAP